MLRMIAACAIAQDVAWAGMGFRPVTRGARVAVSDGMGPTSIVLLDVLTLVAASLLHRRYPQAAFEDIGLLVMIGALMLALGPTTPALMVSALGWAALLIKVSRRGLASRSVSV
jgi:hypothetical protein